MGQKGGGEGGGECDLTGVTFVMIGLLHKKTLNLALFKKIHSFFLKIWVLQAWLLSGLRGRRQ